LYLVLLSSVGTGIGLNQDVFMLFTRYHRYLNQFTKAWRVGVQLSSQLVTDPSSDTPTLTTRLCILIHWNASISPTHFQTTTRNATRKHQAEKAPKNGQNVHRRCQNRTATYTKSVNEVHKDGNNTTQTSNNDTTQNRNNKPHKTAPQQSHTMHKSQGVKACSEKTRRKHI